VQLPIKRLDSGLPLPSYAHAGDAGLDLFSALDCTIAPGDRMLIPTGVAIAIPDGFAGFVQPRSGRALKDGLSFANTPGLIDAHYRGEIKVIAVNLDLSRSIVVARGDKIAQLVIQRVERVDLAEVSELAETVRGEGGFGSTGHR
jgi:dUTP pyrophosphatase